MLSFGDVGQMNKPRLTTFKLQTTVLPPGGVSLLRVCPSALDGLISSTVWARDSTDEEERGAVMPQEVGGEQTARLVLVVVVVIHLDMSSLLNTAGVSTDALMEVNCNNTYTRSKTKAGVRQTAICFVDGNLTAPPRERKRGTTG